MFKGWTNGVGEQGSRVPMVQRPSWEKDQGRRAQPEVSAAGGITAGGGDARGIIARAVCIAVVHPSSCCESIAGMDSSTRASPLAWFECLHRQRVNLQFEFGHALHSSYMDCAPELPRYTYMLELQQAQIQDLASRASPTVAGHCTRAASRRINHLHADTYERGSRSRHFPPCGWPTLLLAAAGTKTTRAIPRTCRAPTPRARPKRDLYRQPRYRWRPRRRPGGTAADSAPMGARRCDGVHRRRKRRRGGYHGFRHHRRFDAITTAAPRATHSTKGF
jgi:hypothetical protein